ncbi:biotin/lipoyl-containing protein [Streptomyces sp. NPDC097610]|uniref:biotin/lipoyl-containing protein n=1 Tax=Streptomyces sp. NPDC097610 TaxID=3157227 RepID=UPI00332D24CB
MGDVVPVKMPKLTMAATEATFLEWLVEDGAAISEGDPIYTVATDKVENEVESPATGTLRHGDAEPETDYQVGTQLGTIETG